MKFLCIYLGGKGGGCCTNACICIGTHSQPLLQNRWMDVYETWQGWSDHGPAHALSCFGHICPGADPGRGKIGHGVPFLTKTSSSDRKATATNRIHSNDLESCVMKCSCFFGSILWKRKTSDPVLWQKPVYQQKCQKGKVTTKTTPQKSSITQRLRTDLGRSVGETTATQLVK